jgi:hypothetical protein
MALVSFGVYDGWLYELAVREPDRPFRLDSACFSRADHSCGNPISFSGLLRSAYSGFCREALMGWCETHDVDYVFGIAKNSRLKAAIAAQMVQAKAQYEGSREAARVFKDFRYRTLKSW